MLHIASYPLTTPITTSRFIVSIKTCGIAHSLSPWVFHYEICISFQNINPKACVHPKVSTNSTQFDKPPIPKSKWPPNQHNDKKQVQPNNTKCRWTFHTTNPYTYDEV
jgi:hypothetical protein